MKFNFNILDMNIETVLVIFLILGLIISFNNKEGLDNLKKSTLLYTKQQPTKPKEGKAATDFSISCSNEDGDDPIVCENKCEAEEKCKNYYWYPGGGGGGKGRCCLKGEYDESSVQAAPGNFYQMIVPTTPAGATGGATGGATNTASGGDNKDIDPCSDDAKKADSCGEVPEDPKSACEQINAEKARMKVELEKITADANVKLKALDTKGAQGFVKSIGGAVKDIEDGLLPWHAMQAMVTNSDGGSIFGGSESVTQNLNNVFKTKIDQSSITDINQKCIDKSKNQYTNSLNIKACTPESMGLSEANFTILAKDNRVGPFVSGVNQSIQNKSTFECALDGYIQSVKDGKSAIDKSAIDSVLNDLKGMGSIKINNEGCNEQTVNLNTCEYLSQQQCCASVKQEKMQNALDVGSCFAHVEDINQSIEIESSSACGNEAGTFKEHIETLEEDDKTKNKNTNKQSPNYLAYIVGGIVAVVCVIALIKGAKMYMDAKSAKNVL